MAGAVESADRGLCESRKSLPERHQNTNKSKIVRDSFSAKNQKERSVNLKNQLQGKEEGGKQLKFTTRDIAKLAVYTTAATALVFGAKRMSEYTGGDVSSKTAYDISTATNPALNADVRELQRELAEAAFKVPKGGPMTNAIAAKIASDAAIEVISKKLAEAEAKAKAIETSIQEDELRGVTDGADYYNKVRELGEVKKTIEIFSETRKAILAALTGGSIAAPQAEPEKLPSHIPQPVFDTVEGQRDSSRLNRGDTLDTINQKLAELTAEKKAVEKAKEALANERTAAEANKLRPRTEEEIRMGELEVLAKVVAKVINWENGTGPRPTGTEGTIYNKTSNEERKNARQLAAQRGWLK